MMKPASLRDALLKAVPAVAANPDMLTVSVTGGTVVTTAATSLSYEKQYPLILRLEGFKEDINTLLVPVIAWLRDNQPDIMTRGEEQKSGFSWRAESSEEGGQNLTLTLQLTERTLVTETDGALYATDLPEPLPEPPVTRPKELYVHGELVSRWAE